MIVKKIGEKQHTSEGIEFNLLYDNPRHGYCGNFEYAVKNTTGDIIFLSNQDDVWLPNKAEKVCRVFEENLNCNLVMTNGNIINKEGKVIEGNLTKNFKITERLMQIGGDAWLEKSVSQPLCNGMVLAFSNSLLDEILPFPNTTGLHDAWIEFNGVLTYGCYHLDETLVSYRLHGNNTAGINGIKELWLIE